MSALPARLVPLALCTLCTALSLAACSREASQPKIPLGQAQAAPAAQPATDPLPASARGALDQGNQAFRAGHYDVALASYRNAAKAAPGDAAPYFGVLMVAQKLGNKALADSASQAIAARNGEQQMLTDSAMRSLHQGVPHPVINGSASTKANK